MSPQPVIEAALRLAQSKSHMLTCHLLRPPNGVRCTCGAVIEQEEALAEFWRQYRSYKEN